MLLADDYTFRRGVRDAALSYMAGRPALEGCSLLQVAVAFRAATEDYTESLGLDCMDWSQRNIPAGCA